MASTNAGDITGDNFIPMPQNQSRIFNIPHTNRDRSEYLHDRDRILFSRAFRRLASKTQVVAASSRINSDHIQSRLTHSLEVMQIASSIAIVVNRNSNKESGKNGWVLSAILYKNKKEDLDLIQPTFLENKKEINLNLIQAIALGHDIGHTAFGHAGEKALFNFLFYNPRKKHKQSGKFHHSFQSLKVCCFLEKAYKPDFFGLNLTIATLDGIFKHTYLTDVKRKFYQKMFDSYREVFWEKIDESVYNKLNECLFEYVSPVTYEGIIVSIADEIAQLCHDIEDIRRLGEFEAVRGFYNKLDNKIDDHKRNLQKEVRKVYDDFSSTLKEVNKGCTDNILKLERLYVKLMINLSIPIVSKVIENLRNMDYKSRMDLFKNYYLGEFKKLKKVKTKLELDQDDIALIDSLGKIKEKYDNTLTSLPDVVKWDIKGRDIYLELSKILYKELNHKKNNMPIDEDSFTIFNLESRSDIFKSYQAGEKYQEKINKEDGFPMKFAVLDYLAGMTDSFTIKEYESLTFKMAELR